MDPTRHTSTNIVHKLKTAQQLIAQGKTVVEVYRVFGVTQPTCHRWPGDAVRPCKGKLLSSERRCVAKRTSRCYRAVTVLQERYRSSERLIYQVVGQLGSTQR